MAKCCVTSTVGFEMMGEWERCVTQCNWLSAGHFPFVFCMPANFFSPAVQRLCRLRLTCHAIQRCVFPSVFLVSTVEWCGMLMASKAQCSWTQSVAGQLFFVFLMPATVSPHNSFVIFAFNMGGVGGRR